MRPARAVWFAAALLIVLAGCRRGPERGERAAPDRAATALDQPRNAAAPSLPPVARSQVTERAWWNQQVLIDAVHLTDAQRAKMDALLTDAEAARRAAQQTQRQEQRNLREAIAQGDWEAARRSGTAFGDAMAALWKAQSDLKIDVLALLEPAQRQVIASNYRYILHQTSVFGRRGRSRFRRSRTPRPPLVVR